MATVLVIWASFTVGTASGATTNDAIFTRIFLNGSHDNIAVCNDGSPAALYFSPGAADADGFHSSAFENFEVPVVPIWHIFLEGGGYCTDERSCTGSRRANWLTASSDWPQQLRKGGIFSRGPDATPGLSQATHAYVRYCSSDSWIGNSTKKWPNGATSHFRGAAIIQAAVETLLNVGMSKASLVLIGGCSAGGRGAFYNVDGVCELVQENAPYARCAGIFDAAWWLDSVRAPDLTNTFEVPWESVLRQVALDGPTAWGPTPTISEPLGRCRLKIRRSAGNPFTTPMRTEAPPIGALPSGTPNVSQFDQCMFGPMLAQHLRYPALFSVSLNDYFQLDKLVSPYHLHYIGGSGGGPVNRLDKSLSDALRSRLAQTLRQHGENTVFAAGCYGHCSQESNLYFDVRLREGRGAGMSLNETVDLWLRGLLHPAENSPENRVFIEERWCGALNCSFGCPPRLLWVEVAKVLAAVIAIMITSYFICRATIELQIRFYSSVFGIICDGVKWLDPWGRDEHSSEDESSYDADASPHAS